MVLVHYVFLRLPVSGDYHRMLSQSVRLPNVADGSAIPRLGALCTTSLCVQL